MSKLWQSKNQFIFCSQNADDDDKNSFQHIVGIIITFQIIVFLHRLMDLIEGFMVAELMLTKHDNIRANTQWAACLWKVEKESFAIFTPRNENYISSPLCNTGIKTKRSDCRVISNVISRAQCPCVCVSIPNNSQFTEFKSLSMCETGCADDDVHSS